MKKVTTPLKGSALVFSLLVLSILLAITVTSTVLVFVTKNSSRATERSTLAFQVADGAVENILKRAYKDIDQDLDTLAGSLYYPAGGNASTCSGGVISGALPSGTGTYSATLYDVGGVKLRCSGAGYGTYAEWRKKLAKIVASGSYASTTRAIDVAVKPMVCNGLTVTDSEGNVYDTMTIGTQCWMKQNIRTGTRINGNVPQQDNGTLERHCFGDDANNCDSNLHPSFPDGGLYAWDEAVQYDATPEGTQGICPNNFHVPTDAEWYTLENFLDATINNPNAVGFRGVDAGTRLKPGGISGFQANLAGARSPALGFVFRGTEGLFHTSSRQGANYIYRAVNATPQIGRLVVAGSGSYSVRCIQN